MKSKSIITLAFILVILMQCQTTIAQLLHPITYNVIRQNSTDIYCETNYMAQKSTPTLVCQLEIHVYGDVVSPTFNISTTKNESIVKIARTLTDESKKFYATYTLSNKEKITLDTYGHDSTREGLKSTKNMGGLRFFSVFVQNGKLSPATVAKFRSYDIETINLGTGVIDVKKTLGINTASIINSMCKKLMENGVNAETLGENYVVGSKSKGEITSSSTSPSYTIKNNLELRDMLVKPLGFVPSNLQNDTYSSIKNCLKAKFKVDDSDEKDNKQLLYVWESENSVTENMNYHGLNFDSFRLSEDKYSRSIMYHFYISKNSSPNPYSYLDIIIRDFNNAGIPLSYEKSDNTYQKASGYINIGSTTYSIDVDDYRVRWDFTISINFRK